MKVLAFIFTEIAMKIARFVLYSHLNTMADTKICFGYHNNNKKQNFSVFSVNPSMVSGMPVFLFRD